MYEYNWKSTLNIRTDVYFKRSKRRILERNNNRTARSFRRGESRFVPKRKSRYQFRSRQKDAEDTATSAPAAAAEATAARRRFTPSSRNKSKYRLNINTKVTHITTLVAAHCRVDTVVMDC